ncbi:hypothetical protein [Paenibacillus tarimensis]|uniref:hypothetical protein n=1 Tax=Paenibacillus tarimensis TaxID=416012 RepID=UPI001F2CC931|nr:hypothetical protein [Paenibacillus tarimensis]MCF2942761.1 hypothetical protein [Paenibacillus tarimensis]
MESKVKQLINVLLDVMAREDERDDAAIDLGNFEGDEVIQALCTVATDVSSCSEMVKGSCGESLALIWIRTGEINFKLLSQLEGTALDEAIGLIKERRTDWYLEFYRSTNEER